MENETIYNKDLINYLNNEIFIIKFGKIKGQKQEPKIVIKKDSDLEKEANDEIKKMLEKNIK